MLITGIKRLGNSNKTVWFGLYSPVDIRRALNSITII